MRPAEGPYVLDHDFTWLAIRIALYVSLLRRK